MELKIKDKLEGGSGRRKRRVGAAGGSGGRKWGWEESREWEKREGVRKVGLGGGRV